MNSDPAHTPPLLPPLSQSLTQPLSQRLRRAVSVAAFAAIPDSVILTCKDTTLLISKSLDTSLPFAERAQIRLHLTFCLACKRYQQQVQLLHTALHDESLHTAEPLPDEARHRLHERVSSSI